MPRILLTNDDGIDGEGLRVLAQWSRTLGEILVVAPKVEQSATGQSIVLRRPIEVAESDRFSDLGVRAYTVDSTPADCVRFSVDRFGPFDFVLSGINRGMNVGYDIAYSGTCGAAFEANYAGLPSVAFSAKQGCFARAADELDAIWTFLCSHGLFDRSMMWNVNIPAEPHGILLTVQGGLFYRDHFIPCGDHLYRTETYIAYQAKKNDAPTLDVDAVSNGFCSVSPLTVDRTRR